MGYELGAEWLGCRLNGQDVRVGAWVKALGLCGLGRQGCVGKDVRVVWVRTFKLCECAMAIGVVVKVLGSWGFGARGVGLTPVIDERRKEESVFHVATLSTCR